MPEVRIRCKSCQEELKVDLYTAGSMSFMDVVPCSKCLETTVSDRAKVVAKEILKDARQSVDDARTEIDAALEKMDN